jgi:sugar phosphate isomerase/epimerase
MTLPFRIGTTSFILPDHILPNVEFLKGKVDDVELLLFESSPPSSLPDEQVIARLAEVGEQDGMTYTVHLPLDLNCACASPEQRSQAVSTLCRIVALASPLDPWAYILHVPHSPLDSVALSAWHRRATESIRTLLAAGIPPRVLCVENLDYPFVAIAPVIEELDLGVCLDTGHLMLNGGGCPVDFLARYRERVRVVHLQGVLDGKDHQSLARMDRGVLRPLLAALTDDGIPRVITIEVFRLDRFRESIVTLKELL